MHGIPSLNQCTQSTFIRGYWLPFWFIPTLLNHPTFKLHCFRFTLKPAFVSLSLFSIRLSELTSLSKNYADAAKYHFDKGSFDKADHYHALSRAAKQEATTAKRVATAAKNKADRAARVKTASERVAAKKLAKAAKTSQPKSKPKK